MTSGWTGADLTSWGKFKLGLRTEEEWKRKMSNPSKYGDKMVLNLECNLLSHNIIIVPAFRELSVNTGFE